MTIDSGSHINASIQLLPRNPSEEKLAKAPALGIIRRAQTLREIGDRPDGARGMVTQHRGHRPG